MKLSTVRLQFFATCTAGTCLLSVIFFNIPMNFKGDVLLSGCLIYRIREVPSHPVHIPVRKATPTVNPFSFTTRPKCSCCKTSSIATNRDVIGPSEVTNYDIIERRGVTNCDFTKRNYFTDYDVTDRSEVTKKAMTVPTAYVITPTYTRLTQEADLLRLCYTLRHVKRVHWIVVEDSQNQTEMVTRLLKSCHGPDITHLCEKTPPKNRAHHRGVAQRNAGLAWIRTHVSPGTQAGGVYFADDDNTYSLELFDQVRYTPKVTVWNVGLVGGALVEGPICYKGKVVGWRGYWIRRRLFPVDMAAFAVSVTLLLNCSEAQFLHTWPKGLLESEFLKSLNVTREDLTAGPDGNCSKVLVWHTQTAKPKVFKTKKVVTFSGESSR